MNNITQTEKLIEQMEAGHSFTMLTALFTLGIQDLRKRLSEVRDLGYALRRGKVKQTIAGGAAVELRAWGIRQPLKTGDFVKVTAAPVLPCGSHPLRGRIGTVISKRKHRFQVADSQGRIFGLFRHRDLLKIADYGKGDLVELTRAPLRVEGFEPQSGCYVLSDPLEEGGRKLFAEAVLLKPCGGAKGAASRVQ